MQRTAAETAVAPAEASPTPTEMVVEDLHIVCVELDEVIRRLTHIINHSGYSGDIRARKTRQLVRRFELVSEVRSGARVMIHLLKEAMR